MNIYVDKYSGDAVTYKGQMVLDTGMFFAPHMPGTSYTYTAPKGPTEFQLALMRSIRERPMIRYVNPKS